jgi:hypothetical protein
VEFPLGFALPEREAAAFYLGTIYAGEASKKPEDSDNWREAKLRPQQSGTIKHAASDVKVIFWRGDICFAW